MNKKIIKQIKFMCMLICSFFLTMLISGSKVDAVDTTKQYPITDYIKGTTRDLDTIDLGWFYGEYDSYETYLFNFNNQVNDNIKSIKNIYVKYQVCKFNMSGKCLIYSDYRTYTISKDNYYNMYSPLYGWDGQKYKKDSIGIIEPVGYIDYYKNKAFLYYQSYYEVELRDEPTSRYYKALYDNEMTSFENYYNKLDTITDKTEYEWLKSQLNENDIILESLFVEEGGYDKNYTMPYVLSLYDKYDWYFIMPVEETVYNMVISADVVSMDNTEWNMRIESVINNQKGESFIADTIEKLKELYSGFSSKVRTGLIIGTCVLAIMFIVGIIGVILSILSRLFSPITKHKEKVKMEKKINKQIDERLDMYMSLIENQNKKYNDKKSDKYYDYRKYK